jgi:hypothetical protein
MTIDKLPLELPLVNTPNSRAAKEEKKDMQDAITATERLGE